ncbi:MULTISPECIES: hypothetical protein [unclassified Pseudodesulfovibrio]|uniref:hypothetical protein n=1 Tax=unclassified Pseudodesulfovibrio TaxID=2661612 RepID=UPI000FEC1938|nr:MULTISPECIES: hypothetical protein [unclassified Pseudodesulfovibrio]MCJ2164681.1 hypothetical protein [Pseudodesulfovibrio sp. S3-i]
MKVGLLGCGVKSARAVDEAVAYYSLGFFEDESQFDVLCWPQSGLRIDMFERLVIVVDIFDYGSCVMGIRKTRDIKSLSYSNVILFFLHPEAMLDLFDEDRFQDDLDVDYDPGNPPEYRHLDALRNGLLGVRFEYCYESFGGGNGRDILANALIKYLDSLQDYYEMLGSEG